MCINIGKSGHVVFCLWLNNRFQALVTATAERYVADMNYVM